MRVFQHILDVVPVDEIMPQRLAEDDGHQQHQYAADRRHRPVAREPRLQPRRQGNVLAVGQADHDQEYLVPEPDCRAPSDC